MGNTAIFNGKEFWIGSVNNQDGMIEEVHTFEEAESMDFHHSFYFSLPQLEKIDNGECSVFWIDDGEVEGEFWRNEGREPWIIGKIKEQIEMLGEPIKKETTFDPKPPMKIKKWKEWQKPFESKLYTKSFNSFNESICWEFLTPDDFMDWSLESLEEYRENLSRKVSDWESEEDFFAGDELYQEYAYTLDCIEKALDKKYENES